MPKVTVLSLPAETVESMEVQEVVTALTKKRRRMKWSVLRRGFHFIWSFLYSLLNKNNVLLNMMGFLLGRVSLMGEIAPFGLAYFASVATVSRKKSLPVAVWVMASVISQGYYLQAGVYFISIAIYYNFVHKINHFEQKVFALPLFMFGAVFLSGLVCSLFGEYTLYNLLLVIFNAALCMMLTYVFSCGIPLLLNGEGHRMNEQTLACGAVLLALAISGIGKSAILGYSLSNMIGGFVIMVLGFTGGVSVGATIGILVGLIAGLTYGNTAVAIGMYAVAGLLAGIGKSLGKVAVILGFLLGNIITLLYLGTSFEITNILTEAGFSAILFALVPARKLAVVKNMVAPNGFSVWNGEESNHALQKLEKVSAIFRDMANFKGTQTTTEKMNQDHVAEALTALGTQVCEACEQRNECWGDCFYQSYQSVLAMLEKAYQDKLSLHSFPDAFSQKCLRRQDIIKTLQGYVQQHQVQLYWQRKCIDSRQLLTEHLKAIGIVLEGTLQEMKKIPKSDVLLIQAIEEKAALLNCPLEYVHIYGEKSQTSITMAKKPCSGTKECIHTVLPLTAGLLHEKLSLHAQCGKNGQYCKLKMKVAKRLVVETGIATKAKGQVSGDTCAVVPLSGGKVALMLSDGMGSGKVAANESDQTITLLKTLLAVGFEVDLAVKTVNSLLILRNNDEIFATMDMAVIDTYSGCTEFLKIGAVSSFVKRVREVLTVRSSSLPIGILNHIEIEPITKDLVADDIIVMVSDGIMDAKRQGDIEWLVNDLRCVATDNPQEIADRILAQAVKYAGGCAQDDMTVIVAKLCECENG